MPDLLKRIGAPLIVAFLILLTIVSMVGGRRSPGDAQGELPWWQAVVLEITAPIERVISAPINGVTGFDTPDLFSVNEDDLRWLSHH